MALTTSKSPSTGPSGQMRTRAPAAIPAAEAPRLRILMIGQRGIPATYGGVEKAVEQIALRLAGRGHRVTVLCRRHYTPPMRSYQRIQIVRLPTIRQKNLEMIVHTFLGIIYAWFQSLDVVHFHGVDPAILSPLITWRHPVVVTSHGRAYRRKDWGRNARRMSRYAESVFTRWPQACTAVSKTLREYYSAECGLEVRYIPNGISIPERGDPALVRNLGLEPGGYILFVGRLDSAKGVHLLVEAFLRKHRDVKLVIVGDASGASEYADRLYAHRGERIIFTGNQYGGALQALYGHCRLFVFPSFTEGLPVVLLEALASLCPLVFSDIPENMEVAAGLGLPFRCGDVDDLDQKMDIALQEPERFEQLREKIVLKLRQEYDWERIVDSYLQSYHEAIARHDRGNHGTQ